MSHWGMSPVYPVNSSVMTTKSVSVHCPMPPPTPRRTMLVLSRQEHLWTQDDNFHGLLQPSHQYWEDTQLTANCGLVQSSLLSGGDKINPFSLLSISIFPLLFLQGSTPSDRTPPNLSFSLSSLFNLPVQTRAWLSESGNIHPTRYPRALCQSHLMLTGVSSICQPALAACKCIWCFLCSICFILCQLAQWRYSNNDAWAGWVEPLDDPGRQAGCSVRARLKLCPAQNMLDSGSTRPPQCESELTSRHSLTIQLIPFIRPKKRKHKMILHPN